MNTFKLDGPGGIPGLKQRPTNISMDTTSPWTFPGNVTVNGTFTAAGQGMEGAQTITSSSANALAVGANGTTNPVFNVDASVSSVATGIGIAGNAAGGTVQLFATSSGTNEALSIDAKGSGALNLNNITGTGSVLVGHALAIGGAGNGFLRVTSSSATALVAGANGSTNPAFNVDASTASSVTGLNIKSAATGNGVAITATDSGSNTSITMSAKGTGTITFNSAVVATAGGAANDGIQFGSLSVGLFTGTGAPTFSAMNGSIYVDSNATTTTTRIYVNKSGAGTAGTTWTNLTTAA